MSFLVVKKILNTLCRVRMWNEISIYLIFIYIIFVFIYFLIIVSLYFYINTYMYVLKIDLIEFRIK